MSHDFNHILKILHLFPSSEYEHRSSLSFSIYREVVCIWCILPICRKYCMWQQVTPAAQDTVFCGYRVYWQECLIKGSTLGLPLNGDAMKPLPWLSYSIFLFYWSKIGHVCLSLIFYASETSFVSFNLSYNFRHFSSVYIKDVVIAWTFDYGFC